MEKQIVQVSVSKEMLTLKSERNELSVDLSEDVVNFLLKKLMAISGKTAYFLLEEKKEVGA